MGGCQNYGPFWGPYSLEELAGLRDEISLARRHGMCKLWGAGA